jgi:hypothetical protein
VDTGPLGDTGHAHFFPWMLLDQLDDRVVHSVANPCGSPAWPLHRSSANHVGSITRSPSH